MKNSLVVAVCLLLSACLFPIIPTLDGGYMEEGMYVTKSKNKTIGDVQRQMLDCGFPLDGGWTNYAEKMPRTDYIKANICMEKHGFRSKSRNKSICHNKWFISTGGSETEQLCQAWLKEFKR